MAGRLVILLVALGLVATPSPATPVPELQFQAPTELEALARQLGALPPGRFAAIVRLTGWDGLGPPIPVALAAEGSLAARMAPSWVVGYVSGGHQVVLLVERVPSYPNSSLVDVLDHEVAHVLIHRAAGGEPLPRWFHEGLAMVADRTWGLRDRTWLGVAALRSGPDNLLELEESFQGDPSRVRRGYAVSGALMREILERFGSDTAAEVLAEVRGGRDFDAAFRAVTGVSVNRFASSFWRGQRFWYRWVPFLASSFTLWMGVTALALVAFYRRRRRDQELQARWDLEDALREESRQRWLH